MSAVAVEVVTFGGRAETFWVDRDSRWHHVQDLVQATFGVPPNEQHLLLASTVLEHHQCVGDACSDGSVQKLEVSLVRSLGGRLVVELGDHLQPGMRRQRQAARELARLCGSAVHAVPALCQLLNGDLETEDSEIDGTDEGAGQPLPLPLRAMQLRRAVAAALGSTGAGDLELAVPALARLLRDETDQVAQDAAEAFGRLAAAAGPPALPRLLELLRAAAGQDGNNWFKLAVNMVCEQQEAFANVAGLEQARLGPAAGAAADAADIGSVGEGGAAPALSAELLEASTSVDRTAREIRQMRGRWQQTRARLTLQEATALDEELRHIMIDENRPFSEWYCGGSGEVGHFDAVPGLDELLELLARGASIRMARGEQLTPHRSRGEYRIVDLILAYINRPDLAYSEDLWRLIFALGITDSDWTTSIFSKDCTLVSTALTIALDTVSFGTPPSAQCAIRVLELICAVAGLTAELMCECQVFADRFVKSLLEKRWLGTDPVEIRALWTLFLHYPGVIASGFASTDVRSHAWWFKPECCVKARDPMPLQYCQEQPVRSLVGPGSGVAVNSLMQAGAKVRFFGVAFTELSLALLHIPPLVFVGSLVCDLEAVNEGLPAWHASIFSQPNPGMVGFMNRVMCCQREWMVVPMLSSIAAAHKQPGFLRELIRRRERRIFELILRTTCELREARCARALFLFCRSCSSRRDGTAAAGPGRRRSGPRTNRIEDCLLMLWSFAVWHAR